LGPGGQDAARLQALRSAADLGAARRARAAGAAAVAATGAGPRAARRALLGWCTLGSCACACGPGASMRPDRACGVC